MPALFLAAATLACGPISPDASAGRVRTAERPAERREHPALPRFAVFGWVSPPRDFASAERYAEMAAAGFDVTVLAWEDSGRVADNLDRLAWTRPHGIRNLILDMRLARFVPGEPSAGEVVDEVVATYAGDPAVLGWYLGDEPGTERFGWLSAAFAALRARDSLRVPWNNLYPSYVFRDLASWRAHIEQYIAAVRPDVLCTSHYEFLDDGDRGTAVASIATFAAIAREHGLPFWGIAQVTDHGAYRAVRRGELAWQAAQWLVHGARGLGWFTYWTPGPGGEYEWGPGMIEWGSGERTPLYDAVREVVAMARPAGEALAGATWLAAAYTGGAPVGGTAFVAGGPLREVAGRAALGWFADSTGATLLLVANRDSAASGVIGLTLDGAVRAQRLDAAGAWQPVSGTGGPESARIALSLGPGHLALLRLADAPQVDAGISGRLRVSPTPARGEVTLDLARGVGEGRLELLDVSGRRVWSARVGPEGGRWRWRGEQDGAGTAPPGLYLARLEEARGVSVRRLSWLGTP